MPRPPLPIGSWGKISTKVTKTDAKGKAIGHMAKANFRDHDGQVRDVRAAGRTASAAEQALLAKLRDRSKVSQAGALTAMHKVSHLIDLWEKKFEERIADGSRSPTSLDTYRRAIKNHIRPAFAELRIGEATTQRIDTAITKIKHRSGAPTAKTCRAVLSGMMTLAVRYGAISVNPVRESSYGRPGPSQPISSTLQWSKRWQSAMVLSGCSASVVQTVAYDCPSLRIPPSARRAVTGRHRHRALRRCRTRQRRQ
jgi:hypothetical protein